MRVQGQADVLITVAVWDTATWKKEFGITFVSMGIPGADISSDGKLLVVAKGGGATQIFDLELNKPIAVLVSPDVWPGNLAISPDGTAAVQGAREGIRLWKAPTMREGSN